MNMVLFQSLLLGMVLYFLCDLRKLIEYCADAVIVVTSNPCVAPLPRTKISFFLLSICTVQLLSTPKITFLFFTPIKIWK